MWRHLQPNIAVYGTATSRAALAVDLLAAAPLASPTTLAGGLGMTVKRAASLLDASAAVGIAVATNHS